MSAAPMPQQGQDQSKGQPQEQSNQGDSMAEFRQFAQMAQQLGQKYPEATEGVVKILQEIKGIMTKVAANPQRTQPQAAPPNG